MVPADGKGRAVSLKRTDVRLAGKASHVLDEIRRASEGAVPADVISQLKRLPALLQTSGVPATMAFLYSKAGQQRPLERAYAAIRDALLGELVKTWDWPGPPDDALAFFDRASTVDPVALSRASVRLREFSMWLRRLAEAIDHAQSAESRGGRDA